MTKTSKPHVWLIVLLIGFPQLSETVFAPILPSIKDYFNTTVSLSRSTLSVYFLGFSLGVFFWGTLSDKFGRKPCLLGGLILYSFASLALYYCRSIEEVLFLRVIQAFGAAVGSIITQTIMRESFTDPSERLGVFAIISSVLSFSPALGPIIGAFFVEYSKFQSVFFFLTIMGASLFFLSSFSLKETLRPTENKVAFKEIFFRFLKDPFVWASSFNVAAFNAIIFNCYSESPFLFMEKLQLSPTSYSYFGITITGFSLIGAKASKVLARKRINSYEIIRGGLLVMIFGCLSYFLSGVLLKEGSLALIASLLSSIGVVFVGIVISLPCTLSESLIRYQDCLGRAGALFNLTYYFGVSVLLELSDYLRGDSIFNIAILTLLLSLIILGLRSHPKFRLS